MKTLITMTLTAVLIGAAGCTTPQGDKYAADKPPPLANRDRTPTTTIDPVKLQTTRNPLTADEINDTNVSQSVRRLEGELKDEGKASAKAGR
jgi:hypothetical protein